VLTIEQAERFALQNNTALLSAEQGVIIAQQSVKEATYLFLPQTAITGTLTKDNLKYPQILMSDYSDHIIYPSSDENIYTLRMSLIQPLYVGGRNTSTLRMARAALAQAQTKYEAARRDALLSIKEAFYQLLYSSAAIQAQQGWLAELNRIKPQAKLGPWEELQARAVSARMEAQLQGELQKNSERRLNMLRALNREIDGNVEITGDFRPQPAKGDLPTFTVWAMEMRPELKSEVYKAEMDAIAVNLAMSRRSPTVTLGASYDFVDNQLPLTNNSWETTLTVQFPLAYDFITEITRKKAEQRQGDLNRADLQDKVRLEVRQAYDQNIYWQNQVAVREKLYNSLHDQYIATLRDNAPTLAALQAVGDLCAARLDYLESVREQLLARANLEWALGQEIPN
jgi:outer membrane protein TolC